MELSSEGAGITRLLAYGRPSFPPSFPLSLRAESHVSAQLNVSRSYGPDICFYIAFFQGWLRQLSRLSLLLLYASNFSILETERGNWG